MARSVSRLNSAAPYNTHAWPPMSRHRTPFVRIEERTLRIGFGIKGTTQRQVRLPQSRAGVPALLRRHQVPFEPLAGPEVVEFGHADSLPRPPAVPQAPAANRRGAAPPPTHPGRAHPAPRPRAEHT